MLSTFPGPAQHKDDLECHHIDLNHCIVPPASYIFRVSLRQKLTCRAGQEGP